MNKDFTGVKRMMWLLLIEVEKEVEDVKCNEMCTDRTLRNILYEMPVAHYVLLCDGLSVLC